MADFLPALTIKAKDFATELTSYNVIAKNLKGEASISNEHVDNNLAVRNILGDRGVKPETLPRAEDLAINSNLLETYWKIGQYIVELEQKDVEIAAYSKKSIDALAKHLFHMYGKVFSKHTLVYMRLLYKYYPKSETLSRQLSWSHYLELLKIENPLERLFYEKKCIQENWIVRELKQQIPICYKKLN
ncbi:DNA-damage-inducible protein D [compost metagenome]